MQVKEWSQKSRANPIGYVICENGCWEWVAGLDSDGYGHLTIGGRSLKAHRYTFERDRGPIPDGLTLDHLCRNRKCCNPAHLEAVSHRVNILRGEGIPAMNSQKTQCLSGHTLVPCPRLRSGRIRRRCPTCELASKRAYREANRDRLNRERRALRRARRLRP